MFPICSLSEAAFGLRQMLVAGIDEFTDISRIKIGHPGFNIGELDKSDKSGLNLFFYHVNYDGYPADGSADNPFYVRLYCLITAVGKDTKKNDSGNTAARDISKGENELRLTGEVMRVLHEQPLLNIRDNDNKVMSSLQIIPHSITLDNLNHIWSTQGSDTPYRLSMAYEMSLAQVPYAAPTSSSPMVGEPHMVVWGAMTREPEKEQDGLISLKPGVEYLEIDTAADDWIPHIALVDKMGTTEATLHYVFTKEVPLTDTIDILIAGKEGEQVSIFWDVWRRKNDNTIEAWQEDLADSENPQVVITNTDPAKPFFPNQIDPEAIDDRRVFTVRLPTTVHAGDTKTWQASLYVVRQLKNATGNVAVRSNRLLLYGEGT